MIALFERDSLIIDVKKYRRDKFYFDAKEDSLMKHSKPLEGAFNEDQNESDENFFSENSKYSSEDEENHDDYNRDKDSIHYF